MAGDRAFARWRLVNTLIFGILAVGGFLAVFLPLANLDLPEDNPKGLGVAGGLAFAGALWSYGRSRYTQRCRKIALNAEWERLRDKESVGNGAKSTLGSPKSVHAGFKALAKIISRFTSSSSRTGSVNFGGKSTLFVGPLRIRHEIAGGERELIRFWNQIACFS